MKFAYFAFYFSAVIVSAMGVAACGSEGTVVNTNANVANAARANSNTAVLVNANGNTATVNRTTNSNVSREDYDRNRAEYERDRGESVIGTGPNDSWIWFKTKTALATADNIRDSTINVDVENEKITLRGTVASAAEKAAAQKVAEGIEGQKGVTNRITVNANDSMTNQMVNGASSNTNNKNQ